MLRWAGLILLSVIIGGLGFIFARMKGFSFWLAMGVGIFAAGASLWFVPRSLDDKSEALIRDTSEEP